MYGAAGDAAKAGTLGGKFELYGVALGLREIKETEVTDDIIAKRMDLFSSVASTSAGGELKNCEILLFGNSSAASGNFRIGHAILKDTMLSDADINYERHARAALGAVIASITNDPAIFVSGGTEHQCGPGAAPIAAILRV